MLVKQGSRFSALILVQILFDVGAAYVALEAGACRTALPAALLRGLSAGAAAAGPCGLGGVKGARAAHVSRNEGQQAACVRPSLWRWSAACHLQHLAPRGHTLLPTP